MVSHTRRRHRQRKSRGVFSTLYAPVSGLLDTGMNVASSAANTIVDVPARFVVGAKNTVRNSARRLVKGVNNIGRKTTSGVDRAISRAFTRKRKNMRRSRQERRRRA